MFCKQQIQNKKDELVKIDNDITSKELNVRNLEKLAAENTIKLNHLYKVIDGLKSEVEKLKLINSTLSAEIIDIETELSRTTTDMRLFHSSLVNYTTKMQSIGDDKIDNELTELSYKKNEILRNIESHEIELREIITSITSLENGITTAMERRKEISSERETLESEKIERKQQEQSASQRLEQLEKEVITLVKKNKILLTYLETLIPYCRIMRSR